MSGMDRLTDEAFEAAQFLYKHGDLTYSAARAAVSKLTDNGFTIRRASQAAPARPTEAMLNAARDWSYAKCGKPIGNDAAIGCWNAMLAAAPAPSDGLREARKEVAALTRWSPKGLPKNRGGVCMGIGNHGEWISRKEVLTILSASPAQEGGE